MWGRRRARVKGARRGHLVAWGRGGLGVAHFARFARLGEGQSPRGGSEIFFFFQGKTKKNPEAVIELGNEKFAQVQDQLGTMDYCFATVDNSFANFAIELTVINSKLDKLLDQICKGQVGADETLVRLAVLRLDVLWARPGPSVDNIALESCFHAP